MDKPSRHMHGHFMSAESSPTFSDLGLAPPVLKAVEAVGYETPSPIQAAAIPPLLEGRDLLGQAQTGTGKTAAFALPALSQIDLKNANPQLLVLAPTRELALQVSEAMQTYAKKLKGFHVLPIYGGASMEGQLRHLKRGVHAVVGTPGRVQDHLRRRTLDLSGIKTVVLDEADEMLRMGFIDDVEAILEHTPESKQVALFSATLPGAIKKIAKRHLKDPAEVRIKAKTTTVETIEQFFWPVARVHKLDALTRILEAEDISAMLIFVRTRISTQDLADKLEARGFAAAALNGDMSQAARERTVEWLKKGRLEIVVATDVAARGLDVERISHVVNYDVPHDVEAYVHRIGRTGRAGRTGKAILFVAPREKRLLASIERATRQPIERFALPTREDIADRRIAQFKDAVVEVMAEEDLSFMRGIIEDLHAERDADISTIAAGLAFMLQRERPLLPPPPPPSKKTSRARKSASEDRPRARRDSTSTELEERPKRGRPAKTEVEERPKRGRYALAETEEQPKRGRYAKAETEERPKRGRYAKAEEDRPKRGRYAQADAEDRPKRGRYAKAETEERPKRGRYAKAETEERPKRGRYAKAETEERPKRGRYAKAETEERPKRGRYAKAETEERPKRRASKTQLEPRAPDKTADSKKVPPDQARMAWILEQLEQDFDTGSGGRPKKPKKAAGKKAKKKKAKAVKKPKRAKKAR